MGAMMGSPVRGVCSEAPAWMGRAALAAEYETVEALRDLAMQVPRYDRKRVAILTRRLVDLDAALFERDAAGL